MKGFGVVLPLLASRLVVANPIEKRLEQQVISAQSIQQDVHGIDTGVYNLRKDLRNYRGGSLQETPLGIDLVGLHDASRRGLANIHGRTESFSEAESTAIVAYVEQTIGRDLPASIGELMAKKHLFQSSGQDALILASLKSLQYDHDSFSAAVSRLLTGNQEDAYNMALNIHNAIQNGIDWFRDADSGVAKEGLRKRDAQPGWDGDRGSHAGDAWGKGEPAGGYPHTPTPSQATWNSAPTPSQINWRHQGDSGSWDRQGHGGSGWGQQREGRGHLGQRDVDAKDAHAYGQREGHWPPAPTETQYRPTPLQANWGASTPSQASWGHHPGATPTWSGNYNQYGGHGDGKGGEHSEQW